jgi:hypothetical protein
LEFPSRWFWCCGFSGLWDFKREPDTRSDEVKQLDRDFPPAKESDFIIPYFTPGQAPAVMPKDLQAFDTSARAWLAGAQFDRTLGNSLVTQISFRR